MPDTGSTATGIACPHGAAGWHPQFGEKWGSLTAHRGIVPIRGFGAKRLRFSIGGWNVS